MKLAVLIAGVAFVTGARTFGIVSRNFCRSADCVGIDAYPKENPQVTIKYSTIQASVATAMAAGYVSDQEYELGGDAASG